jgi:hypothetical protein
MVLAFVAIALLASPSLRLLRHAPKRPNELEDARAGDAFETAAL